MKKFLLIIFVFCLLVTGCTKNKKEQNQNNVISEQERTDSAFYTDNLLYTDSSFHFTAKEVSYIIDTKKKTFTRHYNNGSKTVHFEYTETELDSIKSLYFDAKLDTLSDNFEPDCEISILPSFDVKYEFFMGAKNKSFTYFNSDAPEWNENHKKIVRKMRELHEYISKITFAKKEIQELEPCDIVFL